MENLLDILAKSGFANLTWGNWVMFAIGGLLIFLAINKNFEPLLLIPTWVRTVTGLSP